MAMASTKLGKAWNIVMNLSSALSMAPPASPDARPMAVPRTNETPTIANAMMTDSLPPNSVRIRTSRPTESLPSKNPSSPGARYASESAVPFGSKGTTRGTATRTAENTTAVMAIAMKRVRSREDLMLRLPPCSPGGR